MWEIWVDLSIPGDSCVINPNGEIIEIIEGNEGIHICRYREECKRY